MRLLLFSDTHGSAAALDRLRGLADSYRPDLVCVAGDFTCFGGPQETLIDRATGMGLACAFVSGNNDSRGACETVAGRSGAALLDYRHAMVAGVPMSGVGGWDMFSGSRARRLGEFLTRASALPDGRPGVLLTHEPPAPWRWGDDAVGSAAVAECLSRSHYSLVVCGHFHESSLRIERATSGTTIVNPGKMGVVVVFDPETGAVNAVD